MITVVAAIIYKNNKFLIAKRKPDKKLGGYWEFPGGKVEFGENPEDAVKREIKEELGIQIRVDKNIGESIYEYDFGSINLKGYVCSYLSGKVIFNDHTEVKWIDIDNINKYKMAPADLLLIQKL